MICIALCANYPQSNHLPSPYIWSPYHLLPSNYFPLATTILLSVYEFQFCILHVCKIIWFLTFSNISFSMMFSRSIHVVINGCISSFIYGQWYSIVCIYYAYYMHTYSMYIYIYIYVYIYVCVYIYIYISHLLYVILYCRRLRLFACLSH